MQRGILLGVLLICIMRRLLCPLGNDLGQLKSVGGDQLLLQRRGLKRYCDVIGIRRDQTVAAFESGDRSDLSISQVQIILDTSCLIIFQVQDDLGFGDVEYAFSRPASVEIADILSGGNGCTAVAPDRFEYLLNPLAGKSFSAAGRRRGVRLVRADQFPGFVNEDCFLLCSVFLRFIPNIVKGDGGLATYSFILPSHTLRLPILSVYPLALPTHQL